MLSEYEALVIVKPDCFLVKRGNKELEIDSDNFVRYLDNDVKIEKGVTLRQLMVNVMSIRKLTNFLGQYIKYPLKPFHDRLKYILPQSKEIKYLEFSWYACFNFSDKTDRHFEQAHTFSGIGGSKNKETRYGVSPGLDDILDLPIVIRRKGDVSVTKEKDYKNTERYKREIYKVKFIDLLYTIYYEISWFGTPKKAKDFMEEMDKRVESIDKGDTIPLSRFMRTWALDTKVRKIIRKNSSQTWENVKKIIFETLNEKYLSELDADDLKDFHELWMRENINNILELVEEGKCQFFDQSVIHSVLNIKESRKIK